MDAIQIIYGNAETVLTVTGDYVEDQKETRTDPACDGDIIGPTILIGIVDVTELLDYDIKNEILEQAWNKWRHGDE